MRQPSVVAALVVLLGCGPREPLPLEVTAGGVRELRHTVAVRSDGSAARLKVTRVLRNDGDDLATVSRHLTLPDEAIATAFRLGRDGAPPLPGTFSLSDAIAQQWNLLTSPGDAAPSPIGRLDWSEEGGLQLELFGLLPREVVSIEYDVEVPPRYEAGLLVFDLPFEDDADGWLRPRFEGAEVEETVDGFVVRRQHFTQAIADVRWATAQLDTQRTLWRFEVDAALELERAPLAPRVVFVIDASHSEGPEGIAAQVELVAPYLANAPDALVEVVVTRRFAERLFGRFVSAAEVPGLLASSAAKLTPGNGSNLDVGAAMAAQALSQVGGPGRVVLFTDTRLRAGFSNEATLHALRAAPADTIVHVVSRAAPGNEGLSEQRDDSAALSGLASATGGIFLRVEGRATDFEQASRTLLGLVRPVRVDDFAVEGFDALTVEPTLDEGTMVRLQGVAALPPAEVVVTGKVWAREFRRVVQVDTALRQRLPGLAVGVGALRELLSDDELRTAAFLSHAASPVTSFLAAPPDAAPSTAGLVEAFGLGLSGSSRCGCGGVITTSGCGGFGVSSNTDFEAQLRASLASGVRACEATTGAPATGVVFVEGTGDEVVSVEVTGASAPMTACLTEAAWAVRLGPMFVGHRTYEVGLTAD